MLFCVTVTNLCNFLGVVLLPLLSLQHFIWPLSWCLLADMCNHTWIPECGNEALLIKTRLFHDECDMLEFNCDQEMDYELTNYSECFSRHNYYPTTVPCPYKNYVTTTTPESTNTITAKPGIKRRFGFETPPGQRRYTPKKNKRYPFRKPRTTRTQKVVHPRGLPYRQIRSRTITAHMITEMILLKKETIIRGGKKLVKVVKGVAWKPGRPLQIVEETHEEGFLE